jgi:hypothetical protein
VELDGSKWLPLTLPCPTSEAARKQWCYACLHIPPSPFKVLTLVETCSAVDFRAMKQASFGLPLTKIMSVLLGAGGSSAKVVDSGQEALVESFQSPPPRAGPARRYTRKGPIACPGR